MLPFIAAGASWLADLIIPLLAWEGASKGVGFLGKKLITGGAEGLAERAGAAAAKTGIGEGLTRVLSPVAKVAPEMIGSRLSAEGLARTGVNAGAGLGSLIAGSMAATSAYELLNRQPPSPQKQQQDAGVQQIIQRSQMQDALSRYLGNPDMAKQLLSGGQVGV